MNPDLVATFQGVAQSLSEVFGRAAFITPDNGATLIPVRVMLETRVAAVGEYGERMESHFTIGLRATDNARVGTRFVVPPANAGAADVGMWEATQLLTDDGFWRTFSVRKVH